MIAYITIGSNDLPHAKAFYQAILPPLGYDFSEGRFDGAPATAGNGMMVAFQARTQAEVRDLHGAALAAGGQDDGAPGFRAAYSAGFYVGYLRDPDGNKIALFSSNPDEPSRDD
jgi:predicted lactoylglutathione lyase